MSRESLLAAPEIEELKPLVATIQIMTEVDDWIGLISEYTFPKGYVLQKEAPKLTQRPCMLLWDLTVHPDGDIHLCSCRNVFGDPNLHIGNIKDMTLLEAHEKIMDVHVLWESGNVPTTCKTCSMYCDPTLGFLGRWRRVLKKSPRKLIGKTS